MSRRTEDASTKYWLRNVTATRGTVCAEGERATHVWFGPDKHEAGARIWHHGNLREIDDDVPPAVHGRRGAVA